MKINLISDTVTLPCEGMKKAMITAELGDDVFKTDPTIVKLEAYAAEMFGMESALFCPSGTMTNQIAINLLTRPMDELICDENSHVFHYENAAYARHSGVGLYALKGKNGKLSTKLIESAIRPLTDWYPRSSLVVIENSCNKAGGTHYSLEEMKALSEYCREKGLAIHLDGARIFNVQVEEKFSLSELGPLFDTVSICLSKGLGAPVGSLLLGKSQQIDEARRIRKAMGGGMRQSGILAAAGIFALENNIERLTQDHHHANLLKGALAKLGTVENIRDSRTNIVMFDVRPPMNADLFTKSLEECGILCTAFGPNTVRMVTHKDISTEDIHYCVQKLEKIHW